MNDIYLQKANKYKYKYLKLKNNYIANFEGGENDDYIKSLIKLFQNQWQLQQSQQTVPQTVLQTAPQTVLQTAPQTALQQQQSRPQTALQQQSRPQTPLQQQQSRPQTPLQQQQSRPQTALQQQSRPQTPLQLQLIEKPISVKDFDNNHLYYYNLIKIEEEKIPNFKRLKNIKKKIVELLPKVKSSNLIGGVLRWLLNIIIPTSVPSETSTRPVSAVAVEATLKPLVVPATVTGTGTGTGTGTTGTRIIPTRILSPEEKEEQKLNEIENNIKNNIKNKLSDNLKEIDKLIESKTTYKLQNLYIRLFDNLFQKILF